MSSFTTPTSLSAGNAASMTCIEDLLPRPRKLQAPAIRTEVKQRASSIFEKRNKLKELLNDHGSTFEKRWMRNKKSEQKRIEVLTKVYPTIPRRRLLPPPPLGTRGQDVDDAFRKACFCPTINISDLIIGDVVLESIYHRANNDPCEFVIIDLLNTSIERHGFTPLPVNNNFRMMILDQRSPNDYGNIVPAVASDNRNSIELELGLLVFEIQDFIYAFHLVLLQEILTPEFHQLQKSPAGSMAAGFSERIMDRWPSLSETQLRASYQPTSRADLQRLEILASTQRDEQVNFVADLREDPRSLIAFVADMQRRANSMPAMLEEHPGILDPAHAFATRAVLCLAMEWVLVWNYISCQFGRLVKLEQAGALYDLSGGFTDLASAVFLTLEMYFDKYFLSLYSFKVLTAEPQDNCRTLTAEQKTTAEAMAELKRLVQQLPAARHRTFNGLTVIASEIQKILDGSSDVLSGIEQGNLRAITQASLLAELRRHLQLLRPIGIPASAAAIQIAKAEEWWVKAYTIQNMTSRVELYCTEHSLDPEDPMFKYPAIPKTEQSKERQRAARAGHDAFWNGLDQVLGHDAIPKRLQPQSPRWYANQDQRKAILEGVFAEIRDIASWNRRDIEKREATDQASEDEDEDEDDEAEPIEKGSNSMGTPICAVERVPACDNSEAITTTAPKRFKPTTSPEKHKTRGTAAVADVEPEVDDQEPRQRPEKITIDDETRQLLRIAFSCYEGKPPGEFKYNDVVHMMREIGFQARWATNGYSFSHPNEPRAVGLYRPHGSSSDAKLGRKQFYTFVSRLQRQYSWFAKDNFDLDD